MTFFVAVRHHVPPDHLSRVLGEIRGDLANSRRDHPGRRSVRIFQQLETPTELLALAEWDSQADYERLLRSPAYRANTVQASPPARIDYLSRLRMFARLSSVPLVYSCVTLEAPPEYATLLEAHLLQDMSSPIEHVPGLISREVYRIGERPGRVLIVHSWRTMEEFDAFRSETGQQHDIWLVEHRVTITTFAGAVTAQYLRQEA